MGLLWRYNPEAPPTLLPDGAIDHVTDEVLFEALVSMVASVAIQVR